MYMYNTDINPTILINFNSVSSNMSTPNLLSLPREIRSIIYSHLSESIIFDWGWRGFPFPIGGHEAVRVSVPEAPSMNVLLSCRQIYHEYSQERQFRKSVLAVYLFRTPHALPEGKATNDERVRNILRKVHKLHFVVQHTPHSTPQSRPDLTWMRSKVLIKKIEGLAPRLELMGMVVRDQPYYVARDMRTGAVISKGPEASTFVAGLRAEVQQDYGNGAPTTSAYAAWNRKLDEKDMVVGEWCLRRVNDGLEGVVTVK